jgi:ferrous iron transport protein B
VQAQFSALLTVLHAPLWLQGLLVDGMFRTLAWVVAVMLPPMAIFFPLFTLLEDAGYLPRVAYNLDRPFHTCHACGKQALTMCMGLGCNAAGVVGCRIIDSERERLLAVLTNSLMPCNGRFPALIALMTMFFAAAGGSSLVSALLLTAALVLSVGLTFGATWLLSMTVLRGRPSAFALELPPYRAPQVGQVIVRSVFDRTLFVLGRAAAVAAPAGMILWTLANVHIGGASLLAWCAGALDPLGRVMGMDGVLLLAFVLGFPANEIVLPIAVMGYLAQGSLGDSLGLAQMHALLTANGWTWTTAVSAVLFFLLHWPCSTTLWTIRRETGSIKWTLLAALLPTAMGMALCTAFTALARALGW